MPDEPCGIEGCGVRQHARERCRWHYKRLVNGVNPDKPKRGSTVERDTLGRKLCWGCLEWLAEDRFAVTRAAPDGLDSRCNRCRTLGRHGLTKATFAELLTQQRGRCGNQGCDSVAPGGRGERHVDHDHAHCSGRWACIECVRGLLCHNCNIALGLLDESLERIRGLAAYVVDHGSKVTLTVNKREGSK